MSESPPPYGEKPSPIVLPSEALTVIGALVEAHNFVRIELDFKDRVLVEVRHEEFERIWRRVGGPTPYAQRLFSARVALTQ